MTERCQTKFTEKFENTNYIIYFGVISASLAVLYFYRFHFVVITLSYVLGCVACYYGLKSNILHKYVQQLKCHFVSESVEIGVEVAPIKGCATCGSKDCARHNPDIPVEPWLGLQIHKQLDQAIEDFYNTILDQFINSWYSKITLQPFFVDELRYQLRYASACLLRRAVKINFAEFLVSRLVPCALRHYCACAGESGTAVGASPLPRPHPAASCRRAEISYLRCVTDAIMPYLLSPSEVNNAVFRVLIREIFAGWVLLSLTDVLADPHILNTLVVLATGDETMANLPASPNYKVEFLETFARRTESVYIQRSRLLRVELEQVIDDQEQFYAFVQYLKAASHIHLLLFYKDIKLFQTKLLNPELGAEEQAFLYKEACELYDLYLSPHSPNRVPLEAHIVDELNQLLQAPDTIKRLQTSRALYLAAGQAHAALEKVMLPRFLHSQEYYELLIGSRTPTGYQKQMTKKPQDKLLLTALKLGNKLKGALRPQAIDGQVLGCLSNEDVTEGDGENMDILKYLDALAAEEGLREQDLSTYKVVLTDVDARMQAPPRRGPVRVFTLGVHRGAAPPRFWTLQRSEHDFHLLRAKLAEFHGDRLPPLPSRRDNSPMETLRYKYEDFLQRLLQKSLLQTSELLHLFLTVDSDFSVVVQASTMNANSNDIGNIYQSVAHKLRKEKGQHLESFLRNFLISSDMDRYQALDFSMVVQASTINANSNDIGNIYQSVAHKLRKEKGEHLESFLRNFLVSSDMDRYQALKQGTARDVEEAQEMSEDIEVEPIKRPRNARNFIGPVFGDNFGVEPTLYEAGENTHQTVVVGFTQCFMFLLEKVVRAHSVLTAVIGSVLSLMQNMVDDMFSSCLNNVLYNVLSERRLAHLIRLGHGLLFGKKGPTPRTDPDKQRELARSQLMSSIPSSAAFITGSSLPTAVHTAFEIIQKPQLNKHLVYNLLDLCLMELFPELNDSTPSEPKS